MTIDISFHQKKSWSFDENWRNTSLIRIQRKLLPRLPTHPLGLTITIIPFNFWVTAVQYDTLNDIIRFLTWLTNCKASCVWTRKISTWNTWINISQVAQQPCQNAEFKERLNFRTIKLWRSGALSLNLLGEQNFFRSTLFYYQSAFKLEYKCTYSLQFMYKCKYLLKRGFHSWKKKM